MFKRSSKQPKPVADGVSVEIGRTTGGGRVVGRVATESEVAGLRLRRVQGRPLPEGCTCPSSGRGLPAPQERGQQG